MTDRAEPLTPQTEAGRALYDRHRIHNQAQRRKADDRHDAKWAADILAIERAAAERAARQTPDRDSGLREALTRLDGEVASLRADPDRPPYYANGLESAVVRVRAALATPEEAAPEEPGYALVRVGTGGVFGDGTTNHPPLDFDAEPVATLTEGR